MLVRLWRYRLVAERGQAQACLSSLLFWVGAGASVASASDGLKQLLLMVSQIWRMVFVSARFYVVQSLLSSFALH